MVEVAMECRVRCRPERLHETHLFLRPTAATVKIHAEALEFDFIPADANAESKAATGQFVEGCRLFCHQRRLTLRKDQNAGGESDVARAAGEEPE